MNLYRWVRDRKGSYVAAILAMLFLFLPQVTVAASSYLQELEAEAARTDTENGGATEQTEGQEWSHEEQPLNGDTIEAGLSKEQFEESLKKNFYGSYLFYSTLSDNDQQSVYTDYQDKNDIGSIRESIKSYMKN